MSRALPPDSARILTPQSARFTPGFPPGGVVAYIRKRNGRWKAEVARKGVRTSRVFDTKAEATAWAAKEETDILDEKRGKYPRKTFGEAIAEYLQKVTPSKPSAVNEERRFNAMVRDFPALMRVQLSALTTADMAKWRDARLKPQDGSRPVTPGTLQREINSIRHLFTIARDEWKWMGESPFKGFQMPGENPPRKRRISNSEIRRVVRKLGYRTGQVRTKSQEVATAFLIGLRTAMRSGEILQLGDDCVDFDKRVATLGKHKTFHHTLEPREVPLTRAAVRLMKVLRGRGSDWFTVSDSSRDALFRKACGQALIVDLNFHDSRAEALTRLARKVDVMTLARISGHKDLGMLLKVYYRESAEDIAKRL